jgi:hypothetical protein
MNLLVVMTRFLIISIVSLPNTVSVEFKHISLLALVGSQAGSNLMVLARSNLSLFFSLFGSRLVNENNELNLVIISFPCVNIAPAILTRKNFIVHSSCHR